MGEGSAKACRVEGKRLWKLSYICKYIYKGLLHYRYICCLLYTSDEKHQNVLLFIDNIFRFTQAGSEVSALLGRMPSAGGYQPTLATEMGELQAVSYTHLDVYKRQSQLLY